MPFRDDIPVEQQLETTWCGAASCLYVLKLLGAAGSLTQADVMKKTCTVRATDDLGSTPGNIAAFIAAQCESARVGVRIGRVKSRATFSTSWRPWLAACAPSLHSYPTVSECFASPTVAYIRMVAVPSLGFSAHFIVEDGAKRTERIMDPGRDKFQVNWALYSRITKYTSLGLDIQVVMT